MSELTIDFIEAKQTELAEQQTVLAELIASLKNKSKFEATFPIAVPFPKLNAGELYVGSIVTAEKCEHLILLPGDNDKASWGEQMDWATSIDGRLPLPFEQALLRRFMPEQFQKAAYWSGEAHASYSNNAWYQNFEYGYQDYYYKYNELRARAVRSEAF